MIILDISGGTFGILGIASKFCFRREKERTLFGGKEEKWETPPRRRAFSREGK